MNKNTVKKIQLEFESPPNHRELSLLIIPEAEFQLETENIDIGSGLQDIITLRYIKNSQNHQHVEHLPPYKRLENYQERKHSLPPKNEEIRFYLNPKLMKKHSYKSSMQMIGT